MCKSQHDSFSFVPGLGINAGVLASRSQIPFGNGLSLEVPVPSVSRIPFCAPISGVCAEAAKSNFADKCVPKWNLETRGLVWRNLGMRVKRNTRSSMHEQHTQTHFRFTGARCSYSVVPVHHRFNGDPISFVDNENIKKQVNGHYTQS